MGISWAPWGAAALGRARGEQKPILLSLIASWCHACHRMEDETWDDPAVAAAVEARTVPVRADADARPDLYGRYHLGGLPTTALLTPGGDFVRGGTFLSSPELLSWLDLALADFATGRRPRPRPAMPARAAAGGLVTEVIDRLRRRADPEHGGFGAAPKLPEVEGTLLLLRHWRTEREASLETLIRANLDAVARHLHDPRDGGFFRYAAGADWAGPHTEKIALDQALLIRLYLEAGMALGEARYLLTARQALAHARRRLADELGRVHASVTADPRYYAEPGAPEPGARPAVDRRRFADAAAGMAGAAWLADAVLGEPPTLGREYMTAGAAGRIPHRLDAAEPLGGLLRDQALGLAAALDEYRLTGEPAALDWARRAADWSIGHLWDEEASAFRAVPADESEIEAPALPPVFPVLANGELAVALVDLAAHAGETRYRRHAERVVEALAGRAARSPAGPALALAAQRLEDRPAEAEVTSRPGDPRARALARVVVAALGPASVVRWNIGDGPAVMLCVRDRCLPPLVDPHELGQSLIELDLAPGGILMPWLSKRPAPEEAS